VKALDFPLLADENVHPDVISFLRDTGFDVVSVRNKEILASQIQKFYNKRPKSVE